MDLEPPSEGCDQRLTDAVEAALRRLTECEAELTEALAGFSEAEVWKRDGMRGAADWLCFRFGLARRTAGRFTHAANVLEQRPVVRAALAAGELCLDPAVAVAERVAADEETSEGATDLAWEAKLVERAVPMPA